MEKKDNVIELKSYNFALRVIKLYLFMTKEKKEYELSRQLLRCGTSIGANIEEAIGGHTKKDFLNKINIAYKEARETKYFIKLLRDSGLIENKLANSFLDDVEEILRILSKIQLTTKRQISK